MRTDTIRERQAHLKRGRAHIASAVMGASTRPANDDQKPSFNFDDDFDEGFAFTALLAGGVKRGFHPNSDRFTIIVDSGASDHWIDAELIPRLRNSMKDCSKLKESKTIVAAGKKKVFATATGTILGYIADQAGQLVPVHISAMFVRGLGRDLFPVKAMQSEVITILETGSPELQFDSGTSLPLTQHSEYRGLPGTYFFVPWEARLMRHQRLLQFLQHTQAPTPSKECAPRKRSKNSASTPASSWSTLRWQHPNRKGYLSGMDRILRPRASAHRRAETTRLRRLLSRRLSANVRKSRTSRPRRPLSLRRRALVC